MPNMGRPRSAAAASTVTTALSTARGSAATRDWGSSRPSSAVSRGHLPYMIFSDVVKEADTVEVEADIRRFEMDFTNTVLQRQSEKKTSLNCRFTR